MLRSIGSVVVGYLVFGISAAVLFAVSGQDPHVSASNAFIVFSASYGILFAFLAGATATTVSGTRSLLPALVVSGLIAVAAFASLVAQPGDGAMWSQLAALFLMAPAAAAGGAAGVAFSR